jgi:hypothetical protein
MLWVDGDAALASNVELGSDADPFVLVVTSTLSLDGPMHLHGLVYARGRLSWRNGSGLPAQLNGAAIAEGPVSIVGRVDFWYQAAIMDRLSKATGSMIRVPGSWSDLNQ